MLIRHVKIASLITGGGLLVIWGVQEWVRFNINEGGGLLSFLAPIIFLLGIAFSWIVAKLN